MGKLIVELPDELHGQLKKQAATDRKTLKMIVISLLDQYLHKLPAARSTKASGLCGAWADGRSAKALAAELRASRRWWTRSRG